MYRSMNIKSLAVAVSALVLSTSANAALVERLSGLAYYDTEADLTWLADANYAKTSGYDSDGLMNWSDANTWAAGLDVAGVTGWRLPDTLLPDASCDYNTISSTYGTNCTGSEMGNLFYNVLGNTVGSLTNTGPFSNVQSSHYLSATGYTGNALYVWFFDMSNGGQGLTHRSNNHYAWAVHSGDVSSVPVPSAVWLFGSGLIGLIGLARRKKA
ncbi:MAG: DUF1566 domain-containing protein [Gammaproteobacteria bacterium]|nr:DUF1566 domain-containing protein [Gammaproteobacteria bacterium]